MILLKKSNYDTPHTSTHQKLKNFKWRWVYTKHSHHFLVVPAYLIDASINHFRSFFLRWKSKFCLSQHFYISFEWTRKNWWGKSIDANQIITGIGIKVISLYQPGTSMRCGPHGFLRAVFPFLILLVQFRFLGDQVGYYVMFRTLPFVSRLRGFPLAISLLSLLSS